ncbi:MAG: hypothetical protein JWQ04_2263 [Pedosphaera sp.]|nr:hypothetical protein [Pedosphaera sp.]
MYCSAFVQHLFRKVEIDLAPGVHRSNTTPEDISRTIVPHTTYLLKREAPTNKLTELRRRMRQHVRARVEKIKGARLET